MVTTPKSQEVWRETVEFLRQHGYDATGRPFVRVDKDQRAFERRMIRTPTGGVNGRHR